MLPPERSLSTQRCGPAVLSILPSIPGEIIARDTGNASTVNSLPVDTLHRAWKNLATGRPQTRRPAGSSRSGSTPCWSSTTGTGAGPRD